MSDNLDVPVIRALAEQQHLYFSRYFFKKRQAIKFIVNWHHVMVCDYLERVLTGEIENLIINVPPGSSKTELAVINFIARGLAINPRARFLHLSSSDTLALLNSATARDLIESDGYQQLWPLKIKDDAKSKKRWNIDINGEAAGGVYATSIGGQVTGFRAGHMAPGFQGALIIDDPLKADEAYREVAVKDANRKLLTTIKSRRANPKTPIIIIMQRVAENDPSGFALSGNLGIKFEHLRIPAVIDEAYYNKLDDRYKDLIEESEVDSAGRFSYWPYKEPLEDLLKMERGDGTNQEGARVSRHVFHSQYNQAPVAIGGNIIKSSMFFKYKQAAMPKLKYRFMYGDTAQKTKERNDFSVIGEYGITDDYKLILVDLIRGKWEGPELKSRVRAFWAKAKGRDAIKFGQLRKLKVEDKASGTDLIQTLKLPPDNIQIEGIQREKDKLTRCMDALPYIESGQVGVPEDAAFTNDFLSEAEAFTADDSHAHDDQLDTLFDAVMDMLSSLNKLKTWAALATKRAPDKAM
jgi:predicted phage terminase large subunit-like protein